MKAQRKTLSIAFAFLLFSSPFLSTVSSASAQGLSAGTVTGVVVDPNKAVVPNATVTLENALTGYNRSINTGADGTFRFDNVPFNNYVYNASATGFAGIRGAINIRSSVPITVTIPLTLGTATASVTVTSTGSDLLENVPSAHVDVDKTLINRLPAGDPCSGLSTVVTLSSPGVAADSNGGFHPEGDHFQAQIVINGTPITDQQSKLFFPQIPVTAIDSVG